MPPSTFVNVCLCITAQTAALWSKEGCAACAELRHEFPIWEVFILAGRIEENSRTNGWDGRRRGRSLREREIDGGPADCWNKRVTQMTEAKWPAGGSVRGGQVKVVHKTQSLLINPDRIIERRNVSEKRQRCQQGGGQWPGEMERNKMEKVFDKNYETSVSVSTVTGMLHLLPWQPVTWTACCLAAEPASHGSLWPMCLQQDE